MSLPIVAFPNAKSSINDPMEYQKSALYCSWKHSQTKVNKGKDTSIRKFLAWAVCNILRNKAGSITTKLHCSILYPVKIMRWTHTTLRRNWSVETSDPPLVFHPKITLPLLTRKSHKFAYCFFCLDPFAFNSKYTRHIYVWMCALHVPTFFVVLTLRMSFCGREKHCYQDVAVEKSFKTFARPFFAFQGIYY